MSSPKNCGGASSAYWVPGWWGNDNELSTKVAVPEPGGWTIDALRYSFCLWDMEVIWHERQAFHDGVGNLQPSAKHRRHESL